MNDTDKTKEISKVNGVSEDGSDFTPRGDMLPSTRIKYDVKLRDRNFKRNQ